MPRKEYVFTIVVGNDLCTGRTRSRRLIASLIYNSREINNRHADSSISNMRRGFLPPKVDYLFIEETSNTKGVLSYRDLTYQLTPRILRDSFNMNQWGWNRNRRVDQCVGRII